VRAAEPQVRAAGELRELSRRGRRQAGVLHLRSNRLRAHFDRGRVKYPKWRNQEAVESSGSLHSNRKAERNLLTVISVKNRKSFLR